MKFYHTLTFLVFAFFTIHLHAQIGFPDTTFGNGTGRVITNLFTDSLCLANHGMVQSDGKIIVTGSMKKAPLVNDNSDVLVLRYEQDGKLDLTFGGKGYIKKNFFSKPDAGNCAFIQPDGKIVVGGYATITSGNQDFMVMRLHPNGAIDSTFGTNGYTITDIQNVNNQIATLSVQPDQKIVACGTAISSGGMAGYAMVRYLPDGLVDTTFGDAGIVTNLGTTTGIALRAVILPDGKIVSVGNVNTGFDTEMIVFRHNADGSYDTGFGNGGKKIFPLGAAGSYDAVYAVAVQPDGKIVIGGNSSLGNNAFHVVGRFDQDFVPDPEFGNGGYNKIPAAPAGDLLTAVALQSNGKISFTGCNYAGPKPLLLLYQFNPDGTLDSTFGVNGGVLTDFGQNQQCGYGIAVCGDTTLIAVGTSEKITKLSVILSKYRLVEYPEVSVTHSAGVTVFNDIAVYPNPVSSQNYLQFSLAAPQEVAIELIDLQGKIVRQVQVPQHFDAGDYTLPFTLETELAQGIWLLRLKSEEGSAVVKIVK